MHRPRLLWQLCFSFVLVVIFSLLALTLYVRQAVREFYLDHTAAQLHSHAALILLQIPPEPTPADGAEIDRLCKAFGSAMGKRITVILPSGLVLGDSHRDPSHMENHQQRPEIQEALSGHEGRSLRYSATIEEEELYVATPFGPPNRPKGVVRLAVSTKSLAASLNDITFRVAMGGFAIVILSIGLAILLSHRLSRPIEEMKRGAEQFSRGDLTTRLAVPNSEELGGLAETLNDMAVQLDDRIRTILAQRNEMEAVLGSMVEGVLAFDQDERLISLNQAAARIFELDRQTVLGRSIQEIVRHPELQRFLARTIGSTVPVEDEFLLRDKEERYLQAHGTLLRDAKGQGIGALIVLNDVTPLRRLEIVRKDFVANVSHELKTPITSIKGFVETLLESDQVDKEQEKNFLQIVARQANRLNAIVDDLLTLSSVEEDNLRGIITLETARLKPILHEAIRICDVKARAKNIAIELSCTDDLAGRFNPHLIEQAIVNLVDNAVKYSESGSSVSIQAARTGDDLTISVSDHGCGIEKEHLDRIFERFYRVDKARSRKLGGTGLGLAIVKHILQTHGGRVEVESTPGQGSTFTLHIPAQ